MKDKTTAALLSLFFGWIGIHRFYLGQIGLGVLYVFLMFFGGISVILGIIDAIVLFAMDQEDFDAKYNDFEGPREMDRYRRRDTRRDFRRERERRRKQYSETRKRPRYTSRTRNTTKSHERKRVNPFKQSGIKKYKDFDMEGAIEDFRKGLEVDPSDVALHFNIACAYSITEQADKAFSHLDKAVALGLTDLEKIKNHDDLAYVRIQPEFEEFEKNGFRLQGVQQIESPKENLLDQNVLLDQLRRLSELKDKGLITEDEFQAEKKKLMR